MQLLSPDHLPKTDGKHSEEPYPRSSTRETLSAASITSARQAAISRIMATTLLATSSSDPYVVGSILEINRTRTKELISFGSLIPAAFKTSAGNVEQMFVGSPYASLIRGEGIRPFPQKLIIQPSDFTTVRFAR